VYPQFLHSVADTGWGRLAQRITFCQEQELDLENKVSPTVAQPPGTLFLPTSMTLLTPVHSENDSKVYFFIVLTTDYCWRSWTCRIAAPYKLHIDWLIKITGCFLPHFRLSARRPPTLMPENWFSEWVHLQAAIVHICHCHLILLLLISLKGKTIPGMVKGWVNLDTAEMVNSPCLRLYVTTRVYIPGPVFLFPGIGNAQTSFPGARE